MIKTVIFDIGNVLMSFDWEAHIARRYPAEMVQPILNATSHGPFWIELDRGILPMHDILNGMCGMAPEYEKEIRDSYAETDDIAAPRDYAIPWVKELKGKGYQVLFLSNYSIWAMEICPEALSFVPYMDGGVFSCYEKLVKPDMAIYWKICKNYNLKPSECLFIDDTMKNIEGARKFGLHALQFKDYETSYPEVMKYIQEN